MKTIEMGLIRGRHNMPVEEYVFEDFDITSGTSLERSIDILDELAAEAVDDLIIRGYSKLVLYVTGFTPATVSVILACNAYGVSLTLMHYDINVNKYVPQVVFEF